MKVYALQFLASCAYAALLEPLRERYERWHLTTLPVIGGVLLALAPAAILSRTQGATWRLYERRALLGFVVSGVPIVAWQAWLFVRRWRGR